MNFQLVKAISLVVILAVSSCELERARTENTNLPSAEKINGVSLVGPPRAFSENVFLPMKKKLNAGWVCLLPYAYMEKDGNELQFDLDWQWWGERTEGIIHCIQQAKENGMKVLVKPHVWIENGEYTGYVDFEKERDWQDFENSLAGYLLHYAKLCDSLEVEMFCLGTEWTNAVKKRPQFWGELIGNIREEYAGKLTYSGNWDAFQFFTHWNKLDYIGIDAYFPLCDDKTPAVGHLVGKWDDYFKQIKSFADSLNKQVLFVEYGYRSADHTCQKPWESYAVLPVNLDAQQNAFEAMYRKFWREDWFAGGFVWKWHHEHEKAGGSENSAYTPQNKPAEAVIRKWYSGG